jgi:RND family efflux transporter MFP subunit
MNYTLTTWIGAHKKIVAILIVVILGIGYKVFGGSSTTATEPRYVLGTAVHGDVVSSITGSGQVSATNQIDITAHTSGIITKVNVHAGQTVSKGQLIAQLDARDAAIALENAKISLEKLRQSTAQSSSQLEHTLDENTQSLDQSYTDARYTLAKIMLDLPSMVTNLEILYGSTGSLSPGNTFWLSKSDKLLLDQSKTAQTNAENSLRTLSRQYATLSSSSDIRDIDTALTDTLATVTVFAQALTQAHDAAERVLSNTQQNSAALSTARTDISSWIATISTDTSSIQSAQSAIAKMTNSIKETKELIGDGTTNSDALDLRSAELAVLQKQHSYDDYFIRAPFAGVVADITAQVGQLATGSLGTLITKQNIATLTVNEVDVAKIAVGQQATLTFDAVEGLSVSGDVVEINPVGTVSQGVVSYTVKIAFDTQDSRIKSGMTVNATISTASKNNVLVVPNTAIKTSPKGKYVLVLDAPGAAVEGVVGVTSAVTPRQVPVEIGIVGDSTTEIISGLMDGESIVAKTISATTKTTATTAPSLIGGNTGAARSLGR